MQYFFLIASHVFGKNIVRYQVIWPWHWSIY